MALIKSITERTEGTFRMNKGEVSISYSRLRLSSLIYIALPLFCFFIGWLKWYWIILSCIALFVCIGSADDNSRLNRLIFRKKANKTDADPLSDKKLVISKKLLITVIVITLVYLIFCGIGRLWAQSSDNLWRNAIFRDVIVRDWPIYYDKYDGALCYYIGMWLPAAIPAKLVYLISGSTEAAFFTGNICFLIYFGIGMCILFLLVLMHLDATKPKQVLMAVIGFIFFSGMDVLGVLVLETYQDFADLHLEWWAGFQYSSLTTCVGWVFNQALIPWICTALLLHEKKLSNYVFIGMACLFCGPFPFIGYLVYCIALGIKRLVELIKAKEGLKFAGEVFSPSNICAALIVFPLIGTYLTSNTFMSNKTPRKAFAYFLTWDSSFYILYVIFILFEFAIFAMLIAKDNKKNFLYYITVLQLLIYPFVDVGVHSDLRMRASIPPIFLLYVFCYKFLTSNSLMSPKMAEAKKKRKKSDEFIERTNLLYAGLIFCLIIGAVTPVFEFVRGAVQVYNNGINDYTTDYIVTLNRDNNPVPDEEEYWPPESFVALKYEDAVFFKYFARKNKC